MRYRLPSLGSEPSWTPAARVPRREVPDDIASWLIDTASLTQRLQDCCGDAFRVALRRQRWQRPTPTERATLDLRDHAWALVRQVHLFCATTPLVFARTIMPASTLKGARRRFAHLGNRPLGAMLFADPRIVRCELEVARIEPGHRLHAAALGIDGSVPAPGKGAAAIWGRRSVFLIEGHPLLVSEIFLPAIADVHQGRTRGGDRCG